MSLKPINIHDIEGFKIGNAQDLENGTGCTVILNEKGAVCGVDVRGGGPATRDTDLLNPKNTVQEVNAVLLSGGSAFGLEAGTGVMEYLSEKNIGFPVGNIHVPIVVQADIFDLAVGNSAWPDKKMAYKACENAQNHLAEPGNFGAGTGASVGKMLGDACAMKSGLGMAAYQSGDLQVGAVVAVNACGDVYEKDSTNILAGVYDRKKKVHYSTEELLIDSQKMMSAAGKNTTIGCIITNAKLDKAQMNKLASMTHNAYARCIKPCHMATDGDTIFAMTSCEVASDINIVGTIAVQAMMSAIENAVKNADEAYGLPSYKSLNQ